MAFKSKPTANIGTSGSPSTVSDTVASGYAQTLIGLSFANTSSGNVNVSAKLNKSGGSSAHLIKDATVLPGGALAVVGGDQKVVLEAGDTITAWSNTANAVDVVLSYLVDTN
jgi:hypothetical protein